MSIVAVTFTHRLVLTAALMAAAGSVIAQDDPTAVPDSAADMRAAEEQITSQFQNTAQSTTGSEQSTTTTDIKSDQWSNTGGAETTTSTSGSSHSENRSHGSWGGISVGPERDPAPPNEAIIGRWKLAQDGGNNCTIELQKDEWFGGFRAYTPAGCPDGFFGVNRWVVSGNQLQLTDTNNRIVGRFWPAGDGRWSGKRESDGARLSLNR